MNTTVPTLAAVLFAWAAVHTFGGVYSLALFARMRPSGLYGGFAIASIGAAMYALGSAWMVMASDVAEAVVGQRARMVATGFLVAGAAPFFYTLANRTAPTMVRVALAWGVLTVALTLTHSSHDPGQPVMGPEAWMWPQARLQPAGMVLIAGTICIIGASIFDVCRRGGLRQPDLRLVLFITAPAILGWVVDVARGVAGLTPWFIFVHTSVVASVGASYVLLGRFVRLDEELRERTRELRRSYDELEAAQEELVKTEQLAAVGELSAVIAHEVRHPLQALERAVDSLLDGNLPRADQVRLLGTLDEQADRLNRLVRDLLAYARPMDPQRETVDLLDLLERATAMPDDKAAGVQVDDRLNEDLPAIQGDPDLLLKAFRNIVENALQAMPSGGRLVLTSSMTRLPHGGTAVELTFRDTGEGMDQLVQERARDPFFTTRPSGTGLGLAIVERVVYAHAGTVVLQSSYGGGTSVTVTLPVERTSHPSIPPPPKEDVTA